MRNARTLLVANSPLRCIREHPRLVYIFERAAAGSTSTSLPRRLRSRSIFVCGLNAPIRYYINYSAMNTEAYVCTNLITVNCLIIQKPVPLMPNNLTTHFGAHIAYFMFQVTSVKDDTCVPLTNVYIRLRIGFQVLGPICFCLNI